MVFRRVHRFTRLVVLTQEEEMVVGRPSVELSATDNRFGADEQASLELLVHNFGSRSKMASTFEVALQQK